MEINELSLLETSVTEDYISDINKILSTAKDYAKRQVNNSMVMGYWLVGKRIVLQEQKGKSHAEYGKKLLKDLAQNLTANFGKGYSVQSLYNFRQFYQSFDDCSKFSTLWRILTWSHYKAIMRVSSKDARDWYCNECCNSSWDVRTLERNISTQYYERLLSSQVKDPVKKEMEIKTKEFQDNKLEFIKNPYVLEFLGLPDNSSYLESTLEKALLNNLEKFLLEMGKGFAFVERQKMIRTETRDSFIDLVFYNYLLKCFVLIDLKVGQLTHQDVGQMDMYVRMYDDLYKKEDDNPTIGLLLCAETDKTIAKYSVLNESKQIFASKYLTLLPTEQELQEEIERQKQIINEIRDDK